MAYQLTANLDEGRVELHYSGEVKLEERKKARRELFALCEQHNLARALVEMQDSNISMSEVDVINFASSFREENLPSDYRLAGVIAADDKADKLLEIMITVEGINARFFLNRDEAVNWLKAY